MSLQGTDLQMKSMRVEDAGEYVCEVETDNDPIAIVHTVEILGKTIYNKKSFTLRNKTIVISHSCHKCVITFNNGLARHTKRQNQDVVG